MVEFFIKVMFSIYQIMILVFVFFWLPPQRRCYHLQLVIFCPSNDHGISYPTSMMVLGDYSSLGMCIQVFIRHIGFVSFLTVVRSLLTIFCPICYIIDNGDSYSRLPSDVVRLFFSSILVLVLLPMLIDHFNGCARAHNFGIWLELKL
jgi:hypothetical protein